MTEATRKGEALDDAGRSFGFGDTNGGTETEW